MAFSFKIAGGISLYILFINTHLDGKARHRWFDNLIVFTIVFWALFEQAYTSMNLFADRILDRTVFGYEVSAGQFLSFNALFIIVVGSFF
jgi:POT family proton-dependent oligopeptide transporter